MIVVLGTVVGDAETFDELLKASIAHVRRSRTEAGCVSHDVAHDAENPYRLLFTERWESRAALQAHFEVPASGEFVAVARRLAAGRVSVKTREKRSEAGPVDRRRQARQVCDRGRAVRRRAG